MIAAGALESTAADVELTVVPTLASVVDGPFAVVGVDMPIGLPAVGARVCDIESRRRLGPRRASVFPAPRRSLLATERWTPGLGLNKQTFNLLPKIRELDALVTPALQSRVVEVHPELAFTAMAGAPMRWPKRTAPGRAERLAALGLARPPVRPAGAAPDDVLDALAVLWSAQRIARAAGERVGDGARDARGLLMEIRY